MEARTPSPEQNSNSSLLSIRNVAKTFGKHTVLRDISLEVAAGEFLTILGESGSGKTTLLQNHCRIRASDFRRSLDVRRAARPSSSIQTPRQHGFPKLCVVSALTVEENVAYGPRVAGVPSAEIRPRVEEALAKVRMQAFAKYKPSKISGGQQQRVALARALVNRPQLLLLDEPLSALDANLRRQMQMELKALQREVGITFIFVTHDQEEAMVMSDRIALLRFRRTGAGRAARRNLQPSGNFLRRPIYRTHKFASSRSEKRHCTQRFTFLANRCSGWKRLFSLRPECIRPAGSNPNTAKFHARVTDHSFHGASELVHVKSVGTAALGCPAEQGSASNDQPLIVRTAQPGLLRGDVELEFDPEDAVPVRESEK